VVHPLEAVNVEKGFGPSAPPHAVLATAKAEPYTGLKLIVAGD
jgi:hypothetical protein